MDDSIQTLKDEMNKLMSVYDHVKLKPDEVKDQSSPNPGKSVDIEVTASLRPPLPEKSTTPLITEVGQSVLEVVGDEAVIRFKDFGVPTEEASTSVNLKLKPVQVTEPEYNTELGVYHENEISGIVDIFASNLHPIFARLKELLFILHNVHIEGPSV